MDIAFAPGRTSEEREWARLLACRPNTKVLPQAGDRTSNPVSMVGFFESLDRIPQDCGAIARVIISCHADSSGYLSVPMTEASEPHIYYEQLAGTELLYRGNQEFDVQIWGCAFGLHVQPSAALKAALGLSVGAIISPKHNSVAHRQGDGVLDYLSYCFEVSEPEPITDRKVLLDKFRATVRHYDKTPISTGMWGVIERAVPRGDINQESSSWGELEIPYEIEIGGSRTRETLSSYATYTHRNEIIEYWAIRHQDHPARPADNIDLLRAEIQRWQSQVSSEMPLGLDFPYVRRRGCASIDDYVSKYSWYFRANEERGMTHAVGQRQVYVLELPIVDPATDQLLFNYWVDGSRPMQMHGLNENDERLFLKLNGK